MNSSCGSGDLESVDMVRVYGVENNEDGDEIPGRRSIVRAIEESLAMKIKRIPAVGEISPTTSCESIVVAGESLDDDDDSMGNSEHDEKRKPKENSIVMEMDVVEIPKGNRVGEGADPVSGNGVHNLQPSTEQGTPKVGEKVNSENLDPESEAYILDKLSLLQPSFRTLFEPSINATNNKTRQKGVSKSKWKKKMKDLVFKVANLASKKKQQIPDHHHLETILFEADVKGVLKMRWIEEERKKSEVLKRKRGWLRSCICYPRCSSCGRKEWESQVEEYTTATW